jgi:hypothetical protein
MTFNGETIATTDFRFFNELSGGMSPEAALRDLKNTLVLLERSAQHGIAPTEEQIEEQLESASRMREDQGLDFISAQRIAEFLSAWDTPFESMKDIYFPEEDFEIDEDEFAETLEWQMGRITSEATDMKIRYIKTTTGSSIEGAEELLNSGMDFDMLIRLYCVDFEHSGEDEIESVDVVQFAWSNQAGQYLNTLLSMEVGDVSEIIEIADENDDKTFFIVIVDEKEVDYEQIETAKDDVRNDFISSKRSADFFEQVQAWAEEADVVINNRAFKRFEDAAPPQPSFDFGDFDFGDFDFDENDFQIDFGDGNDFGDIEINMDNVDFDFGEDVDFEDFDFED